MQAYFWHGVGRGAYFAPANSLPYWSDPWQCFETSMRIPHELGRRNAVAGCAWAMTLVNLRQPEIIATLLDQYGSQLAADDAFANGVFSALAVWLRCSSTDSTVQSFVNTSRTCARPPWFIYGKRRYDYPVARPSSLEIRTALPL